jgi:hypothetical protein
MAGNYGYMNIWHTTPPTNQDFPIWAFISNDTEDVVLCRYKHDIPRGVPVTWCKAEIPQPPKDHIRQKYEVLSDSSVGEAWTAYEWFKAGYNYGMHCKGTCGCDKGQALKSCKSPFVDPEEYWEEPKESAFDERL